MKTILTEALAIANATSRSLFMNPREADWYYYTNSSWQNYLFVTGYQFETPIPEITPEGAKPFPPTGYRTLNARTNFFYGITGITPAMAMRLPGVGSQYIWTMVDADKQYFDGAKTYKVTLPKGIPEANFWSLTLYDNMSRSMLDTPRRYPRAGSQSYPSPAAEAATDGSTTVWFAPTQPKDVARGNWIQTMPGKGFCAPAPLQPTRTVLHQSQRSAALSESAGCELNASFACGAFSCSTLISRSNCSAMGGRVRRPAYGGGINDRIR